MVQSRIQSFIKILNIIQQRYYVKKINNFCLHILIKKKKILFVITKIEYNRSYVKKLEFLLTELTFVKKFNI